MKTFKEFCNEGNFYPIDVFQSRWVITDGKDIFGKDGEVASIERFKKDMQNRRRYNQYDHMYFPTEQIAKDVFNTYYKDHNLKIEKMSYAK